MEPFTRLEAVAAPLDIRNLDTNQLCPTRFNKLPIHDPDYHKVLFNNQRFDQSGEPVGEFILNRAPYDKARIWSWTRTSAAALPPVGRLRAVSVWSPFGHRA